MSSLIRFGFGVLVGGLLSGCDILLLLGLLQEDVKTQNEFIFRFPDQKTLKERLEAIEVVCDPKTGCKENVGQLVFIQSNEGDEQGVGVCTGFLVAPNLVATNAHCIPAEVAMGKVHCASSVGIKFITPVGPKIFTCEELLVVTDFEKEPRDFALFRVQQTGLNHLSLSKRAPGDKDVLISARMSPLQGRFGSYYDEAVCESLMNSSFGYSARSTLGIRPHAPERVFAGCQVIKGNSGSPVLNQYGEVVGITHAYLTDQYFDNLNQNQMGIELIVWEVFGKTLRFVSIDRFLFDTSRVRRIYSNQLAPFTHGLYTNAQCVDFRGIRDPNPLCFATQTPLFSCVDWDHKTAFWKASDQIFSRHRDPSGRPLFGGQLIFDEMTSLVEFKPECMNIEMANALLGENMERELPVVFPLTYMSRVGLTVDEVWRVEREYQNVISLVTETRVAALRGIRKGSMPQEVLVSRQFFNFHAHGPTISDGYSISVEHGSPDWIPLRSCGGNPVSILIRFHGARHALSLDEYTRMRRPDPRLCSQD